MKKKKINKKICPREIDFANKTMSLKDESDDNDPV